MTLVFSGKVVGSDGKEYSVSLSLYEVQVPVEAAPEVVPNDPAPGEAEAQEMPVEGAQN